MSESKKLKDMFASLPSSAFDFLLACNSQGNLQAPNKISVAGYVLEAVPFNQDYDNPTKIGVFVLNTNSIITRPTKGSGWGYGFLFNLATSVGLQMWLNYEGYLAIRGKGSSTIPWSAWSVMAKM